MQEDGCVLLGESGHGSIQGGRRALNRGSSAPTVLLKASPRRRRGCAPQGDGCTLYARRAWYGHRLAGAEGRLGSHPEMQRALLATTESGGRATPRRRKGDVLEDGGGRRMPRGFAAGVGGSMTAVKKGVVSEGHGPFQPRVLAPSEQSGEVQLLGTRELLQAVH